MRSENVIQESGPFGSLLVWNLTSLEQPVQFQLHLLTRDRPEYLLPGHLRYRSGIPQVCLESTGYNQLDQAWQGGTLTPGRGRALLGNIIEILIDAADRLLPVQQFTLHPTQIFIQADQKIKLAFWPIRLIKTLGAENNAARKDWGELPQLLHLVGSACKIPPEEIKQYAEVLQSCGLSNLQAQLRQNQVTGPEMSGKLPASPRDAKIGRLVSLFVLHGVAMAVILYQYLLKPEWSSKIKIWILLYLTVLIILDGFLLLKKSATRDNNENWHLGIRNSLMQLAGNLGRWFLGQNKNVLPAVQEQTVLLAANPENFRMALLSEGMPGTPEENEGLRAYILVDEFVIGRDQKTTDLCLNFPGIGRQHARILRRAGSFFLCDLGSRNGTALDNRRLLKNVENLLPDQCLISFADRSFYFQAD